MKKSFLLLLSLLFLSVSCQTDKDNLNNGSTTGEQEVEMTFTSPVTYSSAANDKKVAELDLVVCDKDGIYQYIRPAYTSTYATFRSFLKIADKVDIYFFANCRASLDTINILVPGKTWNQIQSELIISYTDTVIGAETVLPMWGQLKEVDIKDTEVNNLGEIEMLRAVATANICFELTGGKKFTPKEAYVYFGADRAFIAPDASLLYYEDGKLVGVKRPSSPLNMKTDRKSKAVTTGNEFVNTLYMFDNDAPVDGTGTNRYTRIVVGGELEGVEGLTYYPLDFQQKAINTVVKVTRNYKYKITITSVNGEGWPTPDEAAEQAAVNIEYNTVEWSGNEDEAIYIDGPDYISIKRWVDLPRGMKAYATYDIDSSFECDEIKIEFEDGSGIPYTDSEGRVGIESDNFQVVIGKSTKDLRVYTKNYYSTNTLPQEPYQSQNRKKQVVKAKVGSRLKFNIVVSQTDRDKYAWEDGGWNEVEIP